MMNNTLRAGIVVLVFAQLATSALAQEQHPRGMVWVPDATFQMGCEHAGARPDERPVHTVTVSGFWMDCCEVTNRQFKAFVDATGYVTTAEKKPDWELLKLQMPPGTPKPPDDVLVAGSVVFTPPPHGVSLDDYGQWWSWIPGADWKHPEGPDSSLEHRMDHPVVHVSWDDADAYCKWAGKLLPTEAQWEHAARGGQEQRFYIWETETTEHDAPRANIWHGHFPDRNTKRDGYMRTAPVGTYAANDFGLHDMAGNVWEWCADFYRPDTYATRAEADAIVVNPTGPLDSFDPNEPWATKRVQRGGSFLCHESYCLSYRPAARMPGSPDTGCCHVGFRCVMTQQAWEEKLKAQHALRAEKTAEPEDDGSS